jgi:hypothetical protein
MTPLMPLPLETAAIFVTGFLFQTTIGTIWRRRPALAWESRLARLEGKRSESADVGPGGAAKTHEQLDESRSTGEEHDPAVRWSRSPMGVAIISGLVVGGTVGLVVGIVSASVGGAMTPWVQARLGLAPQSQQQPAADKKNHSSNEPVTPLPVADLERWREQITFTVPQSRAPAGRPRRPAHHRPVRHPKRHAPAVSSTKAALGDTQPGVATGGQITTTTYTPVVKHTTAQQVVPNTSTKATSTTALHPGPDTIVTNGG